MDIRNLTPDLSVSPQITAADIPAIKAAGFRAIICNRPDGEGADQPAFAGIARAAAEAGLESVYQPVVSGRVTAGQARAFGAALGRLPGPVLAFCRSGTRSATLWAMAAAGRRPKAEIIAAGKAAGYDLTGVVAG